MKKWNVKYESIIWKLLLRIFQVLIVFNFIIISQTTTFAQKRVVNGVARSILEDMPLPGVNVLEKGTANGTTTDVNGNYEIEVTDAEAVLVFSFVGYLTEEIAVEDRSNIDINLVTDIQNLDEVIVVGYGSVKRSDLTGSVSSVTSKDFEELPIINIDQALQGRAPGVSVTQSSGAPGSSAKIRIRGVNSITGNNDPLYVIDGMAIPEVDGESLNINDININDIKSIEILKDASATAIYGARGANGVILITTKTGDFNQKPTINFNAFYKRSSVPKLYDLMNAAEYAEFENARREALNINPFFSDSVIEIYRQTGGTDWQDEIYREALSKNYQLSLSGGSDKITYFLSGGLTDEDGIIINSGYKRFSIRSNINTKVNDRLTLGINLSIAREDAHNNSINGGKSDPTWNALAWSPTEPIFTEEGTYNLRDQIGALWNSPVAEANSLDLNSLLNTTILSTKLNYKIIEDLTLDITFGLHIKNREETEFWNSTSSRGSATVSALKRNSEFFTWQNSNILTYNKIIGKIHEITLTGVLEQSANTSDNTSAEGTAFPTESAGIHNLGLAPSKNVASGYSNWALRSYLGRINYTLFDRYLITASLRYDGSSKFQGDNKWSAFPSAAVAWRLSQEQFIQNIDFIYNLKLRASWGKTGNQGIRPYQTLGLLRTTEGPLVAKVYSYGTSNAYPGIEQGIPKVPGLKWETTAQTNIGFDLALFKGRLGLNFDYFIKNTTDLLLNTSLPVYNGGGSVPSNIGEVENKGFEINLSIVPISKSNVEWNMNFNLSRIQNEIIDIGDNDVIYSSESYAAGFLDDNTYGLTAGGEMGTYHIYNYLGVWQENDPDLQAYNATPGEEKYEDSDGDSVITASDKILMGNGYPDFTFGLNNTINYKNFEMNLFIQGVYGNDILNLAYAAAMSPVADTRTITHKDALNYWTPENSSSDIPSIAIKASKAKYYTASSRWLEDGSFLRIKNLSISYLLSKSAIKIADVKLTVSAQNLYTFTKYKGYDPEASTTEDSDTDASLDVGTYPNPRVITFGINVTF